MPAFDDGIFKLICLELGIIPNYSRDKDGDELKNMLDQLSPEESRKYKRKFRKLYRKLKHTKKENEALFGLKGENPNKAQRRRRREMVRAHVIEKSIKVLE